MNDEIRSKINDERLRTYQKSQTEVDAIERPIEMFLRDLLDNSLPPNSIIKFVEKGEGTS